MLQDQLERGNNGLIKSKHITFGIEADGYKTAKPHLERIETDILNNFRKLGVKAEPLDGKARLALKIMHSNRPDLFPGYLPSTDAGTDYEIPPEALEDEQFVAMMAEAEKYIGFPYVWGGSNPSTSFDCSGFVSWVVNNCGVGWSVGRLTAQGLYNICTPVSEAKAKPGDLVFFEYTCEGPWITHVGIYVGEGWMVHAGNPVGYIKFMDSYYSDNFVGFGRLPAV